MSRVNVLCGIYWAMALLKDLCASTSITNDFLFRLLNGALQINSICYSRCLAFLFRLHGAKGSAKLVPLLFLCTRDNMLCLFPQQGLLSVEA